MYDIYSRVVGALPDELAIRLHFRLRTGYWPDLKNPVTFNEKIQWRKLNGPLSTYAQYADKLLVKEFVARVVGPEYVIPTLWSGSALPELSKRTWPVPYVLKCNYGSGNNLFIRSESDSVEPDLQLHTQRWLRYRAFPHLKERFYELIDRQIFVEPLLGENLNDYKFYVVEGKVHWIHVDTDRFVGHKRCFFDRDWNAIEMKLRYPLETRPIPRPQALDEMIFVAEALGSLFDFVRVDLYQVDGRVLFGEITFTPGGGCERFEPRSYDALFGASWQHRATEIPSIK